MRIRIRRDFKGGEEAPWYWGRAYTDYLRNVVVAYIIPLNWIVWLFREIHWTLRWTPDSHDHDIYMMGYRDGQENVGSHTVVEIPNEQD